MEIYEPQDDSTETREMTMDEFNEYKASCEYVIKKADEAKKLSKNPYFISIIMEDYFSEEPKRLGSLMASGHLTPSGFDGAVGDLRAIGHLRGYLSDFIAKGNIARDELAGLEEARAAAIAEQEAVGGAE